MTGSTKGSQEHPVKAIAVLGATGNIGVSVLDAILERGSSPVTSVTVITRQSSQEKTRTEFADRIKTHPNLRIIGVSSYDNYTDLIQAFKGQGAVVSCIATFTILTQSTIADACVAAGVKRFIPSEFGADTSNQAAVEKYLLPAVLKRECVDHLVSLQPKGLSWSAIIVGMFFDWGLKMPGFMVGHDLANNKIMVFDGGHTKVDGTNVATIGKAVASVLLDPEAYEASANQYVKVNSFYVSQNEYIAAIERFSGRPVERIEISCAESYAKGMKLIEEQGGVEFLKSYNPTPAKPYPDGAVNVIHPALFGYGPVGRYSEGGEVEKWNALLKLPKENLDEVIKGVVQDVGLGA